MKHKASRIAFSVALLAGLAGPVLADPAAAGPAAASAASAASAAPALPAPARPNVLLWLMDDVGFGQIDCFGGLVETPNIDRVARAGLRYANYHTAPICSASRAAVLTGRMPHSVHIGGHATAARDFPGYDAKIPASAGTVAANLHAAGYATFALGKWDHLPSEEASPAGPFNRWATGQGFDRFYGFLSADTDNWNPVLIRDVTPVARPATPGYHLSADLADKAIAMIGGRDARQPQRPFFMYWATGAAHAPHHAPAEWIARYRGKFDQGWDAARAAILKRQVAEGLVPKGTILAPRPDGLPAWSSLTPDQKRLYARQMEVFAASLSYADAQFGRILDALEAKGELANTMVIVTSDNGASAEGGPDGLYNESEVTSRVPPGVAGNLAFIDKWGGPQTYPHYAYGWAVAGDTPYRYYKQTTHEGGTRVPLVVSWPRGIAARGETRAQFTHVADIAPTILDAAGVPLAATINDVPQVPMEGESFVSSFAKDGDPRGGRAQYVEMYGNKGLWWQGWSIVTTHRTRTWDWNTPKTFDEPWELYDLVKDPGQTTDLAAKFPDRVAQMAKLFGEQAERFHVYPIHNLSDTAAEGYGRIRRDFEARGGKWRFAGPVSNIPSALAPPVQSRSFAMRAQLDLPRAGVTGPVFAYGGQLGGIGLYLDGGKPVLIVNSLKGEPTRIAADEALGAGAAPLGLSLEKGEAQADGRFLYHVTMTSGGRRIADRSLVMAVPGFFGIPETFDIGNDAGSPVLAGWTPGTPLDAGLGEVMFDFSGYAAPAGGSALPGH